MERAAALYDDGRQQREHEEERKRKEETARPIGSHCWEEAREFVLLLLLHCDQRLNDYCYWRLMRINWLVRNANRRACSCGATASDCSLSLIQYASIDLDMLLDLQQLGVWVEIAEKLTWWPETWCTLIFRHMKFCSISQQPGDDIAAAARFLT